MADGEKTARGARLEVSRVTKTFAQSGGESQAVALDCVSFSLEAGRCAIVAGANGSGKSVLMSIVAGLSRADSGEAKITRGGKKARAGLVFQEAETQILGETPIEDVSFGLRSAGLSREEAEKAAREALAKAGLAGKEFNPARFLSGGEKRRLAIAAIIALDRPLVIFDEPYSNLDLPGVRETNAAIKSLKDEGRSVIILTHEIEKCLALADRFIVLHKGKIVFDGTPREALKTDLEEWGIKNPLSAAARLEDMAWM